MTFSDPSSPDAGAPTPPPEDSMFDFLIHSPSDAVESGGGSSVGNLEKDFCGFQLDGILFRRAEIVVYRAREVVDNGWVLLEVLDASAGPERRERFHHGTRVLQAISDPGVATLLDQGERDGHLYRVLEDFEGASLAQYLETRGSLPPRVAVECIGKVALALAAVHEAGFVHRDVQPDHIWIGVDGRILLVGFGSVLDPAEQAPGMTMVGERYGDPRYRSPEEIRGGEIPVGPASDQFALGVVLYRLLLGRHPFEGASVKKLEEAILNQDPPPPDGAASGVAGTVDSLMASIVGRSLAKDPGSRFPDCRRFAAEIKKSLRSFGRESAAMTRISPTLERSFLSESAEDVGNEDPLTPKRYQDLVELDRGGAGVVFAATDSDLERSVAIKLLHEDGSDPFEEKERRFLREAKITGRLEHPNIVPIYELGRAGGGKPFYSMKRIEGHSFRDHLASLRDRLVEQRVNLLGIFLKVCDGVSFAHSKQIVHRDLKPANIMLGEYGEVLVVDWGLARFLGDPVEFGSSFQGTAPDSWFGGVTIEGTIMGTPFYMAPEQARGETEEIDTRTDIYALGVVLYEILTGILPYGGASAGEVVARVVRGHLIPPSERIPGLAVPRELDAVVLKAMALHPDDRYRTILDFQKDIQAYLDGRLLGAVSYSPVQRMTKWIQRNRKVCAVILGMVVLAGGLYGVDRWREWTERERRFEEALLAARGVLAELRELPPFSTKRSVVDEKTGAEFRESHEDQLAREQAIRVHLAAASHLEKALQIHPGEESVLRDRIEVGTTLGDLALGGRDYLLARVAYERLADFGLPSTTLRGYLKRIEDARSARITWRRNRIGEIFEDFKQGLSREDRSSSDPLLDDYVFEVSSYRDVQTVDILGGELDVLIDKVHAVGGEVLWSQSERDRAKFICRVLGRLGLPSCVSPLGRWMGVVADREMAVEAGIALCNTRHPDAQVHLLQARDRLGILSAPWIQIRRFFDRIPDAADLDEPVTANDFFKLGLLCKQKEQFGKAIEHYSKAIELHPEYVQAYNNRANARKAIGDFHGASLDLSRAIEIDRNYFWAYLNRGEVRMAQNDLLGAIADYDAAIGLDPKFAVAYGKRGKVRSLKRNLAMAYNKRGKAFSAQKDWEGALADFDKAIGLDPKLATAYNNRGNLRRKRGDLDAAMADLDKAIELDPEMVHAYTNRGVVRKNKGQLEEAMADYNRAIELEPQWAGAFFARSIIRLRSGDLRGALADNDKGIEIDPTFVSGYINRGRIFRESGDLDAAILAYDKAIELDPKNATGYSDRGIVRKENGDPGGALDDFGQGIRLDPGRVEIYRNRGELRGKRGDWDGAIADWGQVIRIDPRCAAAYYNRGIWFGKKNDSQGAMADYHRAIELDPKLAEAYVNRGNLYREQRVLDRALVDYQKAIRFAPGLWQAWRGLGQVLALKGQADDALEAMRKAWALAPEKVQRVIASEMDRLKKRR